MNTSTNLTISDDKRAINAINKRDQYRMLVMSESIMAYIVNVTTDVIEDEFYQLVGGGMHPVLQFLGMPTPCSFTEAYRAIAEGYVHDADREGYLKTYSRENMLASLARGEDKLAFEYRAEMIDGSHLYLRRIAILVRNNVTGDVLAYITDRDITKSKEKETMIQKLAAELSDTRESYETLNKAMQSATFHIEFNDEGKAIRIIWSDELRRMLGYKDERDLPNTLQSFLGILHHEDWSPENDLITRSIKLQPGEKSYSVDYRLKMASGAYRWFRATGNVARHENGTPHVFHGAFFDINEQKIHDILMQEKLEAYEEMLRLRRKVMLDELTGVYNRNGFFEKAAELMADDAENFYIVRFNICRFKIINELYGMEKGDQLLKTMGKDLKEMGQKDGFITGRFTADHFYLCIRRDVFSRLDLPRIAPAPWLGMDITMTYGVYAVGEQQELPVNIMCDRADMAVSARRQAGAEYIFYYDDNMRRRMMRDQVIEQEMEDAVTQRQFCIYIQPKYDVDSGSIAGGEALVRWRHPEKGLVSPGEFIPVFERNGFIKDLDYYVWEECCAFISSARKRGIEVPPVSVNVSRIHFYGTGLREKLEALLDQYELTTKDLELEITETIYAEDADIIIETCRDLRDAGFKIAMDDFGSAYSSLNMLKKLPLDTIKMDLRFLAEEGDQQQREKGRNILRSLITMAKELMVQIVVEGVETDEQKEFIRLMGGCLAQGYYFARPMPAKEFESFGR